MTTNTQTLYSIVLTLTPTGESTIGATMGHQAHAAFLQAVAETDPDLAATLHTPNARVRPFTVSPLQGTPTPRNGRIRLSTGDDCWLRCTILQEDIYRQFMARFLQAGSHPLIRLGKANLLVREILTTPGAHPYSGYTTWAELVSQAELEPECTLRFESPTAFGFGQKSWGKKIMLLPDPEAVFDSLARSWNHLAPDGLQMDRDELRAYTGEHIVTKQFSKLETRMFQFRRSPQVGFVGEVTYGFMGPDGPVRLQLNALADFAFYTGVGMKTAMGMGQCRRIRKG